MAQTHRKVAFHTLGCKLNQAETDGLRRGFEDRGYMVVDSWEEADICLLNTCSVTERADSKCRQAVRQAVRSAPQATVIVTGCYAQVEAEVVRRIPGVDMVLGAGEKFRVFEYLETWDGRPLVRRSDHRPQFELEDRLGAAVERTRAFLKIQDGCGFNCTFCIIPTTRGDSRSRASTTILQQAEQLLADGFQELVLTGVNLIQYRDRDVRDLAGLLRALCRLAGGARIRLGSIEPNGINRRLLETLAEHDTICRHLHIPLQSGDAGILARMGRRYEPRKYREVVEQAAALMPLAGIGADVMAGFPGETEAAFENTRALLRDLPMSYLHVFQFSARSGTPAAAMDGQVEKAVMYERCRRLRELGDQKKRDFLQANVGRRHRVLFEEDAEGLSIGLTSNYLRLQCAVPGLADRMCTVLATGAQDGMLTGALPPADITRETAQTSCVSI